MPEPLIQIDDFVRAYAPQANRFMWFLGAGASRNAQMPTASDLVWELKLRQYCREEGQDIQSHDLANKAIRARVQSYFDSKAAPPAYGPAEYTFFFEHAFGSDYSAQQRFLQEEMSPTKISLNIGNRILAALMAMDVAKVVFTTNFDEVLEQAMAEVAGRNLAAFHLEGTYAVLDAMNADQFPIYAKLHGDFRYRSIKNLAQDLLHNDREIERAFLAAATRFGVVVTGYSGRDESVMRMFHLAIAQNNAFPAGLYWTVTQASEATDAARALIAAARAKGISAAIVEAGTFDILMTKLWPQLKGRPDSLLEKVQPHRASTVSIPLPKPGNSYPLLRTNALPVKSLPARCGRIHTVPPMTYERLRAAQGDKIPEAAIAVAEGLLYWGSSAEVEGFIPAPQIKDRELFVFEDPTGEIMASTILKGFFEHGLAKALCADKPVVLRRKGRTYYIVASTKPEDRPKLKALARAVGGTDKALTSGDVPRLKARWAEAVTVRLEERAGAVYLLLEPTLWITPLSSRDDASNFMKAHRLKRYNRTANQILNAWITILLGAVGDGTDVTVTAFADDDHPAPFTINTRTAYSRLEVRQHG